MTDTPTTPTDVDALVRNLRRLNDPATEEDSIETADAVQWIDEAANLLATPAGRDHHISGFNCSNRYEALNRRLVTAEAALAAARPTPQPTGTSEEVAPSRVRQMLADQIEYSIRLQRKLESLGYEAFGDFAPAAVPPAGAGREQVDWEAQARPIILAWWAHQGKRDPEAFYAKAEAETCAASGCDFEGGVGYVGHQHETGESRHPHADTLREDAEFVMFVLEHLAALPSVPTPTVEQQAIQSALMIWEEECLPAIMVSGGREDVTTADRMRKALLRALLAGGGLSVEQIKADPLGPKSPDDCHHWKVRRSFANTTGVCGICGSTITYDRENLLRIVSVTPPVAGTGEQP